jgi:7-cyano-7-deazaguanine synthase in queuosine biosynthesis
MEKILAKDGLLCNIPSDKTCNLVVLFSGGFDSTALLHMAVNTKKKYDNIKTVYALYVKSNLLDRGKVKLESSHVNKFISYINQDEELVKLVTFKSSFSDLEEYSYSENAYDLIFVNAINSVVHMMGGADTDIVLNGSLDRDSRTYHLPYYKKMVEEFNQEFRGVDIRMVFPFIQSDKPRILDYLINNKLYQYCTCCENPKSGEFCNSCKGHLEGLFGLMLAYKLYGDVEYNESNVDFVEEEINRMLGVDI